jgi:3-oxoadipate enol-lactonase
VGQERRVALGDHETCVVDLGSGRPTVFVHAIGLDREMWRDVIELLDGRRVAYDLRGHGCAAGAPKPFTLAGFAADLRDLLDVLGIEQAHVAGLSLGGAIAQVFALTYPDRVSELSLVCTTAVANPVYLERGEAVVRDGVAAQVESTLERWFTSPVRAVGPPPVRYARERLLADRADDLAATWHALAGIDTLERLGEIAAPTRVIAGEVDASTPPASMEELAARIPQAEFHVVPNGPHMLSLERPQELAALLR